MDTTALENKIRDLEKEVARLRTEERHTISAYSFLSFRDKMTTMLDDTPDLPTSKKRWETLWESFVDYCSSDCVDLNDVDSEVESWWEQYEDDEEQ
jgi:hypothetical protein